MFDGAVAHLTDTAARRYWEGVRACDRGDYATATIAFAEGGERGQAYAQALDWALAIRRGLGSAVAADRERAIGEWASWQGAIPGPHEWRDAAHWVTDYAGAETLYSIARNTYMCTFRTGPTRPVRLRFIGPVRLRIDVRPLLPKNQVEPWNGWVRLAEKESLNWLPLTDVVPAQGLEPVESDGVPGTEVSGAYTFGPGLHDVAVSCAEGSVLVRVFHEWPAVPLGVLPPLTPETLACAWHGLYVSAPPTETPAVPDYDLVVLDSDEFEGT